RNTEMKSGEAGSSTESNTESVITGFFDKDTENLDSIKVVDWVKLLVNKWSTKDENLDSKFSLPILSKGRIPMTNPDGLPPFSLELIRHESHALHALPAGSMHQITTHAGDPEGLNGAALWYFQVGPRTLETTCILNILVSLFTPRFFTQIRTK